MNALHQETILLVDDSPDVIEVLGNILRSAYRVQFAVSGKEALALAEREPPSLILLDAVLPEANGHEVCRYLKANARTRDIPVILLTGDHRVGDEQLGFELGADDYLYKPPNPALVLQRVRLHLALRNKNVALECCVQERTRQLADEIAERKRVEIQLQGFNRSLRTISHCNDVLVHAAAETELLQDMCQTIVETGQYRFAWVAYVEDDLANSVRPVARFGADDGFLDQAMISWADADSGPEPIWTALRTGVVQVSQDFASHPDRPAWGAAALERGYAGCIALPLTDRNGIFGSLCIYAGEPNAFDAQQVELLTELAGDLSYGISALRTRDQRDKAMKDLQLAAKVFEKSKEGIFITDAHKKIVAANASFTAITGYSEAELHGQSPKVLRSDRHDATFFEQQWYAIEQTGYWVGEIWNRRKNGDEFPVHESICTIRDNEGTLTHYLAILTDMTQHRDSEERIRYLTQHDALTGLANRTLLIDRLEQAIVYTRQAKRQIAVILLDIDSFKLINDSLGHAAGDELLRQVANRLAGHIRPGDSVARLGGDEFVLVYANVATEHDVALLARNLLALIASPLSIHGQQVVVTASLGVALFPRDGDLAALLLQNADAAMSRAKGLGRNSVRFYAPEMNACMRRRLELESGLRWAIEREEFVLYYQPKVELTHGEIIGSEALIRWCHPTLGMVSPGDFIPLAEETGLIVPIGEWVLNTACRQIKAWERAGFSDLVMSVNLSARQFQQANLMELVTSVLQKNNLPGHFLELEVTESAVMQDPEQTISILGRLKKLGIRISLDDFGTGYSSLNYLKRFPIDILKIDQTFIRDITSDPEDAAIACAVISLAHNLKHKVIAEGVETDAQMAILRRHRCNQIQGYLFSPPLPAEAYAELLRQGKTLALGASCDAERERTLLVVDDEKNVLSSLKRLLRRDGYQILTAGSASEAFELLALNEVQVIISDQRMPEMSGTEFLCRVKEMYPDSMRLMLSGYTELNSITDAINRGAIYKFLTKPWEDDVLREQILETFMFHESKREKLNRIPH